MAANTTQATPTTNWSYSAAGDGQVHENPEWEKARQALASINKSQSQSTAKTTQANRTTAEAGQFQPAVTDSTAIQQQQQPQHQQQQQQQYYPWYQQTQQHYPGYTYPYNYYYPMGPYGAAYPPNQYGVPAGGPYPGTPTSNGQPPPVPGMEDQSPNYPSQPQPPPPSTPQPPQSPTTSEKPPPPPPPPIPPSPNSQYPAHPSQNSYSATNSMQYPPGDPNQMQVYNHSQGRPNYGQGFQAQNTYQPSQNTSQQQQQSGQYVPGLGRGDNKNKNQKQGQQLWHRMKQAPGTASVKFNIHKRPYQVQSNQTFPPGEQPSGLNPTPSSPASTSGAPGGAQTRPQDWPQAMKEYVQRCFTACETEEDKDRTEKVLKEVLQDRLKDGSAYTIDWTREPLPELKVKQSRWESVPSQRSSDGSVSRGGSTAAAASRGRGAGHRLGHYRNIFSQRSPSSSSSNSSSRSPSPSHGRHRDRSNQRHRRRNMEDSNATVGKKRKGGNAGLDFHDPNREAKKQSRAARFHKQLRSEPLVLSINSLDLPDGSQEGISWEDCPIVGTCQDITKSYLRLTCAPDASTVRPVQIVVNLCDVLEAMELKNEMSGQPKVEQVKEKGEDSDDPEDETDVEEVESDEGVMETTPQMEDASVVKYSVKTTPYLQSVKKAIADDASRSTSRRKSNIKDLKFLTPVRRSCRIERKSTRLPTMLVDHDPCVSSLAELVKLDDDDDANAYIYRKNPALLEDLPDQPRL